MQPNSGLTKAAVLMLALGEEGAANVMKYISPRDVERLGAIMATLHRIERDQVAHTLHDFFVMADKDAGLSFNADEFTRNVLSNALGNETASGVFQRVLGGEDFKGIESLRWMDSHAVADLIRYEHPQIIATILVHLDPDPAAQVLTLLNEDLRKDVMLRVATFEEIKPLALKELNAELGKLLALNQSASKKQIGGIRAAAEIMNFISGPQEAALMDNFKLYDAEIAQKIMDEMFVFDDILGIEDKGIQIILRDIQTDTLIVALKGSGSELREKIYKNMSTRAAEMIREDLENKGPVKLSDVESAQKEILQIVRNLVEAGQIILNNKGDETYV